MEAQAKEQAGFSPAPTTDNAPMPTAESAPIVMGFETAAGFAHLQRVSAMFSQSQMVPKRFQRNVQDCVIAVEMASRLGSNPLMVMQNLYVVHGSPAWSAQFLIATFNQNPNFTALRYEFKGEQGSDDWSCRACAVERSTGETLFGTWVSISIAKGEGWFGKSGSKWQTMPEQMLRYRAAAWFIRAYAPEISMGIMTKDEVVDTIDLNQDEDGTYSVPEKPKEELWEELFTAMGTDQARQDITREFIKQSCAHHSMSESDFLQAALNDIESVSEAFNEWAEKNAAPEEQPKASRPTAQEMKERRDKALAAYIDAGGTKEQAEKEANAFAGKWTTKQCEKVMKLAEELKANGSATGLVDCPNSDAQVRLDVECKDCPQREGCPAL